MASRKGSKNRRTLEREAAIRKSGLTPLDYLLSVLRDEEKNDSMRMDAAKAAAPYVHPRLAAVEHSGEIGQGKTAQEMSDEELLHIIAGRSGSRNAAKAKSEKELH